MSDKAPPTLRRADSSLPAGRGEVDTLRGALQVLVGRVPEDGPPEDGPPGGEAPGGEAPGGEVPGGGQPTREAVRLVVDRCHRMARAYLRRQRRAGALREDVLGEDVDDLAIDAIAGLFRRGETGEFPELREYFSEKELSGTRPEELSRALRRLTFGAVSDWLFEAYRAADRSLSNFIRALKRAAKEVESAELRQRGQTLWLEVRLESFPSGEETETPRRGGRTMPIETLEAHLTGELTGQTTTKELLRKAAKTLRAHPDYEAAYPLTRLAQALRAARARVQTATGQRSSPARQQDPLLRRREVEKQIGKSLARLREEKRPTYVGGGKLSEQTYEAYIGALRDRLESQFMPGSDADLTHRDALSARLSGLPKGNHSQSGPPSGPSKSGPSKGSLSEGGLSREEYRTEHRARFEYLYRRAREALIDRLQKLL